MVDVVEFIANIVTILGFPISIILVIKELRSNNKSVKNIAESIKNQQIINTDKIEQVTINNKEVNID